MLLHMHTWIHVYIHICIVQIHIVCTYKTCIKSGTETSGIRQALTQGPKNPHKHQDPTNDDFWSPPYIGPWNQNVRSSCQYYLIQYYTTPNYHLLYFDKPYHNGPYSVHVVYWAPITIRALPEDLVVRARGGPALRPGRRCGPGRRAGSSAPVAF